MNFRSPIFWTFIVLVGGLFFPFNKITHIKDFKGHIMLSRIDRKSILLEYGTFFSPGIYQNWVLEPDTYINPFYIQGGPLDDGCFELFVEFKDDTIVIYEGSFCKTKNLTPKFQLIRPPNAFGNLSWSTITSDTTGKYMRLDCIHP